MLSIARGCTLLLLLSAVAQAALLSNVPVPIEGRGTLNFWEHGFILECELSAGGSNGEVTVSIWARGTGDCISQQAFWYSVSINDLTVHSFEPSGRRAVFDLLGPGPLTIYDQNNQEVVSVLLKSYTSVLRHYHDPGSGYEGEHWRSTLIVSSTPLINTPEPATWHIAGFGLFALALTHRRYNRRR